MRARDQKIVRNLLDHHGHTFAEQAGFRVSDRPSNLYQLQVLSTMLSARISSDVALSATRELFKAGYKTPQAMNRSSWHDRVDALGRGHYRRYDNRTSTMLGDGAKLNIDRYRGDLRRLRAAANGDPDRLRAMLTEFPGIGPVGADIFMREVQGAWPEFEPFLDAKVRRGADKLKINADAAAKEIDPTDLPRFASALVDVPAKRQIPDDLRR